MADLIDDANETAELFLRISQGRRSISSLPEPTGRCFNCDAPLDDPARRWCDADCRDDYLKARNA